MKLTPKLLCFAILLIGAISCQQQKELFVTLDGATMSKEEASTTAAPHLHIVHPASPKGTVVYYPSSEINSDSLAQVINELGYSAATLLGETLQRADAKVAYRLIHSNPHQWKLNNNYIAIVGHSEGARLAALTQYGVAVGEQPHDLIVINPSNFDETAQGTVTPLINPPLSTTTRLLCIADTLLLCKSEVNAASEYTKTWIGYDGVAFLEEIGATHNISSTNEEVIEVLTSFWQGEMTFPQATENTAALPVEGQNPERHAEKVELIKNHKYDLLFVGNSITHNFEKPAYRSIWEKYYGSRNAINLGYSGYRTENILWNLQNGELENQSPKVIVLEIGTNNVDEKHYPTRHTAGQLAGGMEAIVKLLREQCPDSKIILLRCFPGSYDGPNPTSHRNILERASDMVVPLADDEHVFYCDVNHVFLNMDGSINQEMMPDWLHPSPKGAALWAQAMEPLLSKLMEDALIDDDMSSNTALIPTSKLEEDGYDWWERHSDVLAVKDSLNPAIVLIGNSITHFWGGEYPPLKHADGTARAANGAEAWQATFGNHRVLNLGFGWDRTQNVLWRLDNGELDGLDPQLVIVHIGTNNTSETKHARMNTASEIVEGIETICLRIRSKVPRAKLVVMQIMPREEKPGHPRRRLINETNELLKQFASENEIALLDISSKMLTTDGILTKDIAPDFCHPTDEGYQIWGDALRPYIENICH